MPPCVLTGQDIEFSNKPEGCQIEVIILNEAFPDVETWHMRGPPTAKSLLSEPYGSAGAANAVGIFIGDERYAAATRLYDSRTCALGSMILPIVMTQRHIEDASTLRLSCVALTTSSLDHKGHPANQQQR